MGHITDICLEEHFLKRSSCLVKVVSLLPVQTVPHEAAGGNVRGAEVVLLPRKH